MATIWKDVKVYSTTKTYDFTGIYKISDQGQIMNCKRQSILKDFKHKNGYHTVALSKNGFTKSFSLHRVVASSFYTNPNNKRCVNHIDRNPSNNNASNLEWVTVHENVIHSRQTGINSYTRSVIQLDVNGNVIQQFISIKDASLAVNISQTAILRACKLGTFSAGYMWEYANKPKDCVRTKTTYYNQNRPTILVYDVDENDNYEVYEDGRIYSKVYKRFLNPVHSNGYLSVTLYPNRKSYYVHQIVAKAFIDNPDNKKYVNHIDRNKHNNHVSNLEWCTHQENMEHAHKKTVYQYDKEGKLIKKYESVKQASTENKISECTISSVCHGTGMTAGGYIWRSNPTIFTPSELHNIYNPPNSRSLEVIQLSNKGNELNRFPTVIEAAKSVNVDPSTLAKACRGVTKSCKGYLWKYSKTIDGATYKGSKRLSTNQRDEIKSHYIKGITVKQLANMYSKSVDSIRRIVKLGIKVSIKPNK